MPFVCNSVVIIVLLLFVGCRDRVIKFNPDFHVGDYHTQSIISERGDIIPCSDPRFSDYAALHIEKIKELKKLLLRLEIPQKVKGHVKTETEHLEKYIEDNR